MTAKSGRGEGSLRALRDHVGVGLVQSVWNPQEALLDPGCWPRPFALPLGGPWGGLRICTCSGLPSAAGGAGLGTAPQEPPKGLYSQ